MSKKRMRYEEEDHSGFRHQRSGNDRRHRHANDVETSGQNERPSRNPWDPLNQPSFGQREQKYVRKVRPQNENQAVLIEAMSQKNLVVAIGPAGTGKTYLAICAAVDALESGRVDRIILSRPAVESGEHLGYLPGDLREKMSPYLRPLYDALNDRLGVKRLKQSLSDGIIEIAPIGFMRGRTLNNAFVVIDEAQNCTYVQLKMLLTRLGWHSTMVLTGDPDQSDLLNELSGLAEIARRLESVEGVGVVKLTEHDIVRHPLVASMLSVL